MIRDFKFFTGNEDDYEEEFPLPLDEHGTSWTWTSLLPLENYTYDVVETHSNGIHAFLDRFPIGLCVPVLSITGPNGRFHDANTEYDDGWGFDVTSDLLTIKFLRFES
jgi:hypothetical protein